MKTIRIESSKPPEYSKEEEYNHKFYGTDNFETLKNDQKIYMAYVESSNSVDIEYCFCECVDDYFTCVEYPFITYTAPRHPHLNQTLVGAGDTAEESDACAKLNSLSLMHLEYDPNLFIDMTNKTVSIIKQKKREEIVCETFVQMLACVHTHLNIT